MWPLVVVHVAELVEALLLALHGLLRRPRRFGFERTVHPLVCAVLLRGPGHDPLVSDPEAYPPKRQARNPCQPWRSERTAVVREDRPRQSVFAEDVLKGTDRKSTRLN